MFKYFLIMQLAFVSLSTNASASNEVWSIEVKGGIGPGVALYLDKHITRAEIERPKAILVLLDTPGGLVSSLRQINQSILASSVPIIMYVHPPGARAASAGTYMLYASHVAAMAPATNLGAATPVRMGGGGGGGEKEQPDAKAMRKKIVNDSVAYIRGLAELRGRNADWAEKAVREGESVTSEQALELKVIDIISSSPEQLIQDLQGWQIAGDVFEPMDFTDTQIVAIQADWRDRFITGITNPNIAYILMMIGVYGLLFEFYSPGFGIAGVLGAICLVIAMFALQMMPVNYAGLALLLLGLALFVAESLSPSFGILGGGGIVAFIIGSIFLFDTKLETFRIAYPLIGVFALTSFLFMSLVFGLLWRSRNNPVVTGDDDLIRQQARALESFDEKGLVSIQGERWQAITSSPINRGDRARVSKVEGLTLHISPIEEEQR